mgnify:CR=1 FL=1
MRLKILVIPFSILISLILVIGYIKPDITEIQEKKVVLEGKIAQTNNVSTLISRVESLSTDLASRSDDQRFVEAYLPQEMDQERVIDMFNFLAGQSGVLVSIMSMKEIQPKVVVEETLQVVAGTPVITDGSPVAVPQVKPKVKAYSALVEVRGEYLNIRDFFNRLSHMNRFGKMEAFSMAINDTKLEGETPNLIKGVFQAEFNYFPMQKVGTALNIPVVSKGAFSDDELSTLRRWVESIVSPLEDPVTGRPNPFQ